MKIRPLKLTLAIIAAVTATSMSGCYFFPDEEKLLDPPTVKIEDVTYSTYTAKTKTIADQTIVSGYVTSKTESYSYFTESGGVMKTIYVRAGEFVEAGDLLAELDTGDLDYRLEQQKLIVQRAQLYYNQSGSATDRLTLEMEQSTLTEYQREFDASHIYAKISGQVGFVESINAGAPVTPYKVIVKIIDPENLYVKYTSNTLKDFPLGKDVTIAIGENTYPGVVSKTPAEAIANGEEDTSSVWIDFTEGIPGFASVGTLADVTAVYTVHENAVVIPKTLIKSIDDRTYVQLLVNDEKVEVDVTTGIENATEIEVLTGINAGDKVVVR